MSAATQAFFDEHREPSHASKDDVHGQLAALLAVGARVQKQLIEYHAALDAAELSDPDPAFAGKIEMFRQTLGAADREAKAFVDAGRQLAKAFSQLDRYVVDAKADIARVRGHGA